MSAIGIPIAELIRAAPLIVDFVNEIIDWASGADSPEPQVLSEIPATSRARLAEVRERELARRSFEFQGAAESAGE